MILQLPPVSQYQADGIWCPARYGVIEGSTKAGKTYPCLLWLLQQAIEKGGNNRAFWWAAPVSAQANIAYRRLTKEVLAEPIRKKLITSNETRQTITLPNGSTIWFKSAEDPDNLYGEEVFAAVADEASRWREESWHALRSTLTTTRGPVRLIGNVKGRKNWAYKLARLAEGGAPDMHYARFTCHDAVRAGFMAQSEVDDARRLLPDAVFRELYEAIPTEDGANPFDMRAIAFNTASEADLAGPVACWGVDLARAVDWTVAIGLNRDGFVVAFHRWQHVPWAETVDRLAAIIGDTPCLADSTGVGDAVVEALQRKCRDVEGFKFSSTSKQELMQGLSLAISGGAIKYPAGQIVRELEAFEFEHTRTGVRYSAPQGSTDDCVMALALAVKKLAYTTHSVSGPAFHMI